jgi:hypothetical protein
MTVPIEPIELIVLNPAQGGAYPFTFRWLGGTGLALTLFNAAGGTELPLAAGADWSASPAAGGTGGVVTLLADPTGFDRLRVRRRTPVAQEFEAPPTAAAFEAALDRVAMAQQEREGDILDAVRQVLTLDGGVVETNPVPAINAEVAAGSAGALASVRALAAAALAADAAAAAAQADADAAEAVLALHGTRLTALEGRLRPLFWRSATLDIVAGGPIAVAHPLGVTPDFVGAELVCISADAGTGHAAGAVLRIAPGAVGTATLDGYGFTVDATSAQVTGRFGIAPAVFYVNKIVAPNLGQAQAIDPTRWRLRLVLAAFA